tara:strand:+ start:3951 stop:4202 length:252 start_codon:yes stop_codon:yes gene_type:complete
MNEEKLISKATESIIKARNYSYKNCESDLSIEITKNETENYTYINLKGYQASTVAVNLQSIFSAIFSIQINSNDNVNISIFKG